MYGTLARRNVLTMILAGGQGERLFPLTKDRAKPAVPFGGRYRIVDFVINNFINSGFFKIKVLTQFKSNSLIEHITRTWRLVPEIGQYVDIVPAQMRRGPFWFRGTADAVFQNLELIFDEKPEYVCVFGGDHIYKMDVNQMLQDHIANDADLTIATIPVPVSEAHHFGVVEVDDDWRVTGFVEKPKQGAKTIPDRPDMILASMGNYIFKANVMIDVLQRNALRNSGVDFGKEIIPEMFPRMKVMAYDFATNYIPGEEPINQGYWRDVGTVDSYFAAALDLVAVTPLFNLYNPMWPMISAPMHLPPAKFVFADSKSQRIGIATDSLVSDGSIISGGTINRCVLHPRVRIHSFADVDESILMDGVEIGRHSKIRRTIIDKGVKIPPHTTIGYDIEEDRHRFTVTDSGIVVVPKGAVVEEKVMA
ncbi:MAG TPA: glucose-1-phosphate adenylyltransferase [Thermoanaerobaculia bacterium]|jgi:glucose-1-phosphate adenylyltransferase|nr:glucose-1-phosphate adenylyltransferase [Thermoanaerobaculia bacterium]